MPKDQGLGFPLTFPWNGCLIRVDGALILTTKCNTVVLRWQKGLSRENNMIC